MPRTQTLATLEALSLTEDELKELEEILIDLNTRKAVVPQWELCDGYLTALACTRREIPAEEWLVFLLGDGSVAEDLQEGHHPACTPPFATAQQQARFVHLCQRRIDEVRLLLDLDEEDVSDDSQFLPATLDLRGAIAALPEEERAEYANDDIPAFAQVWALGFLYATECWFRDWAPSRNKESARWLREALKAIRQLTEDDTDAPTTTLHESDDGQEGPPSISQKRLDDFSLAIEAVYELRALWKNQGPRIEPLVRTPTPGRNDPCWCASGVKFKKCHGA